jgi:hypothetical protein
MTVMTTASLIAHLLTWFAHGHHVRAAAIAFYRQQQPGMPRGWYAQYVRDLIRYYPHTMNTCLHALAAGHHAVAARVCP